MNELIGVGCWKSSVEITGGQARYFANGKPAILMIEAPAMKGYDARLFSIAIRSYDDKEDPDASITVEANSEEHAQSLADAFAMLLIKPRITNSTFFIQDTRSYHGNLVVWWAKDGHGYTSHLEDAWEVDEEKARSIERNRDTDKAWPADQVRAAASMHVDIQRLHKVAGT